MSRTEQVVLFAFLALSVLGMATAYLLLDGVEFDRVAGVSAYRVTVPESVDEERQQVLERMAVGSFQINRADAALLQALSDFYAKQLEEAGSGRDLLSLLFSEQIAPSETESHGRNIESYRKRVQAYVEKHGVDRYVQLGLYSRRVFLNALRKLTNLVESPEELRAPENVEFVGRVAPAAEKLIGGYLAWSIQSGLALGVGSGKSIHLFLAGLVYKFTWIQWIGDEYRPENFLTGDERQAFTAYRAEFEPGLKLRDRQKLLGELRKHNPGYPIDVMQIVILAKFGRANDALTLVNEALGEAPDNRMLLSLKALAERRLEREREAKNPPVEAEVDKKAPLTGDAQSSTVDIRP